MQNGARFARFSIFFCIFIPKMLDLLLIFLSKFVFLTYARICRSTQYHDHVAYDGHKNQKETTTTWKLETRAMKKKRMMMLF